MMGFFYFFFFILSSWDTNAFQVSIFVPGRIRYIMRVCILTTNLQRPVISAKAEITGFCRNLWMLPTYTCWDRLLKTA